MVCNFISHVRGIFRARLVRGGIYVWIWKIWLNSNDFLCIHFHTLSFEALDFVICIDIPSQFLSLNVFQLVLQRNESCRQYYVHAGSFSGAPLYQNYAMLISGPSIAMLLFLLLLMNAIMFSLIKLWNIVVHLKKFSLWIIFHCKLLMMRNTLRRWKVFSVFNSSSKYSARIGFVSRCRSCLHFDCQTCCLYWVPSALYHDFTPVPVAHHKSCTGLRKDASCTGCLNEMKILVASRLRTVVSQKDAPSLVVVFTLLVARKHQWA